MLPKTPVAASRCRENGGPAGERFFLWRTFPALSIGPYMRVRAPKSRHLTPHLPTPTLDRLTSPRGLVQGRSAAHRSERETSESAHRAMTHGVPAKRGELQPLGLPE